MKLTLDQLRSVTFGTARVSEENGVVRFFRFTNAQSNAYLAAGNDYFYTKSFAAAGVRFAFFSNTSRLSFSYTAYKGASRPWFGFDIYADNRMVAHREYALGEEPASFRTEAELPAGEKKIEVYLPFSARIDLSDFSIDDGATLTPAPRSRTMYAFGDSITHGYDSHYPSLSYVNRLAFLLDADPVNKGIGGDVFFPDLLDEGGDAYDAPDDITVAYGTNDWSGQSRERTEVACRAFYQKLSLRYPSSRIFAVTPVWRGDGETRVTRFGGPLRGMDRLIADCVADLPNVSLVSGEFLIPHAPEFFIPDRLHPNELGFLLYAANLREEILKR